jgi:hypothetical protein
MINMAARVVVPANQQAIPGFVLARDARVLVRAVGPGLLAYGITNYLPDPKFTLYKGSSPLFTNDNWSSTSSNQAIVATTGSAVGAFALVAGSRDAAAVYDLPAGAYTAVITGAPGTSGEVLLEVYYVP